MIDPLMLSVARVSTFAGGFALTGATGFFFRRDDALFLVTSRHVVVDPASGHHPDRLEIVVHLDPQDLRRTAVVSLPLYDRGVARWRQGMDSGGEIDVAVLRIEPGVLPADALVQPFTADHLQQRLQDVTIGTPLLVLGFPLGFYDTLHNLPVARQGIVASAFGVRFQGEGYFLTDARAHRGVSGAPVLMHAPGGEGRLPWRLLGVHSARLDMRTREAGVDEALGLNCVWYADILNTLTAPA